MCQYSAKLDNAQICQKMDLLSEISKTNVGIRISIVDMPGMPLLTFWAQICQKMDFGGQNFKNLSLDSESASLRYCAYQFPDIRGNFKFLDPNFPQNGFWGQNFKNLNLDLESASLRYSVH